MGPHDLLCKWCSTFVGKDKQFCSIFCESRHTRSKRRKLAYKKPVQSAGTGGQYNEYVSPRASNTAPSKKQFLEDVITAMKMEDYKSHSRGKTDENDESKDSQTSEGSRDATPNRGGTPRRSAIPRLDMSKLRNSKDTDEMTPKSDKPDRDSSKPEYKLKSKTHTIYVHNKKDKKHGESRKSVVASEKENPDKSSVTNEKSKTHFEIKTSIKTDAKIDALKSMNAKSKTTLKQTKSDNVKSNTQIDMFGATKMGTLHNENPKKLYSSNKTETDQNAANQKVKTKVDEIEPLHRQQSKIASDLADRVRSSGYGAPVNLRLRPVSLKPKSASMQTSRVKRESSAKSTKSSSTGLAREKSRPFVGSKGQSNWELVQTPINEETKTKDTNTNIGKDKDNTTLEHEKPSPIGSARTRQSAVKFKENEKDKPKTTQEHESPSSPESVKTKQPTAKPKESQKTPLSTDKTESTHRSSSKTRSKLTDTSRRELQSIEELLREESTGSILDASVLQSRLSSIKRKVEVRRRGRDSRSSVGSDLDSTLDTSLDTTTGRDKLDTSFGDKTTPTSTSRLSARSNITRISKEFRSTKVN